MPGIVASIQRHRGLLNYTILNYADKAVAFAVPLLVLYLFGSKDLYNEVEYIYSLASVVSVLIEMGFSAHFLYACRHADDKNRMVEQSVSVFHMLFTIYGVISLLLIAVSPIVGFWSFELAVFVSAKTLALMLIMFYANYYRMIDQPSRIFALTLSLNITTIVLLAVIRVASVELKLWHFFVGQLAIVSLGNFWSWQYRRSWRIGFFAERVRAVVLYAWPILLNVFLFMFVNNYGKVYARNFLSTQEMFQLSFVQRLTLIIQLAHASSIAYMTKRVFIDPDQHIKPGVVLSYSGMLSVGIALFLFAFVIVRQFNETSALSFDLMTVSLLGYTIFWCYGAFLEMYITRMNKNKYLLAFGVIGALVFVGLVNGLPFEPIQNIAVAMVVSTMAHVALVLSFLYVQGAIRTSGSVAG